MRDVRVKICGLKTPGDVAAVVAAGAVASLSPAWRAYRLSLADGLSPRV